MDVILLTSYFLIIKLSFVCKRVYIYGENGSDRTIVIIGRRLRHEISAWRSGEQQLTDSIEVLDILYVHATRKVEGGTEGVERDGGGQGREGDGVLV